nr:helix-turn-helix transcriptional regulator [Acetatifactor muris]
MMRKGKLLKKSEKKDKNNILLGYLRTYLIVLFIPLMICSLYSIRVLKIIEEDDVSKITEEYEHSAESVDTFLDEVERIGRLIADNAKVRQFAGRTDCFSYPNLYKIIELQNTLSDISFSDSQIFNYFIFFEKGEAVINSKAAYTYKDFYDIYLHEEQYKTYDDWYSQEQHRTRKYGLATLQNYKLCTENSILPMLTYEIPVTSYSLSDKCIIKIYIRKEAIESLMPAISYTGVQFITDRQGNVTYFENYNLFDSDISMTAIENTADAGSLSNYISEIINLTKNKSVSAEGVSCKMVRYQGEQYLLVQCHSSRSGLTYYALQSSLAVKVRGYTTVLYMLLIISIAAMVGILLSIKMSTKIAKPINELINDINDVMESGPELDHKTIFSHMQKSYKRLKDINTELQDVIESQQPYLENFFLNQLLYGKAELEEDIGKNAEYIHFDYHDKVFWVVIFKLDAATETIFEPEADVQSLYILSITEAARKVLPDIWMVNNGHDKAVAILALPRNRQENYRCYTEEIVQKVKNELLPHVAKLLSVYGGTLVSDLSDISTSYENAAIMHIYIGQTFDANILWYTNQKAETLSYPSAEKSRILFRQVLRGEAESVYVSFKEIIQQYFINGNFSTYMQNLLLDDLQINLVKIIELLEMEEEQYKEYYLMLEQNHNGNLLDRIRITQSIYLQTSQYVYEQKTKKTFDLAAITAYINLNFGDSSLSLTSAAEALRMNEGYLSGRFKQETGINFSAYVEKVRMNKAKELLKAGNLTIKEIAACTGYTSENSFCRAFKRVTGVSTSGWKNIDSRE